ncbi:MAG: hypothetical protein GY856_45850 [bacterium]|nr:hypothetical protein [bacterium]
MAKRHSEPPLVELKFSGPSLGSRSIPINELSATMAAFQQLTHKSCLFKNDRLKTTARLTNTERDQLALQLADITKGSDIYSFIPFDPGAIEILKPIMKITIEIIAAYVTREVYKFFDDPKLRPKWNLLSQAYEQMKTLTRRIDRNIDRIEIIPGNNLGIEPVVITQETHGYVVKLESEEFYGEEQVLHGSVLRLDLSQQWADIRIGGKTRVRVDLPSERTLKDVVHRVDREKAENIPFIGQAIQKIGSNTNEIKRFKAERIGSENDI